MHNLQIHTFRHPFFDYNPFPTSLLVQRPYRKNYLASLRLSSHRVLYFLTISIALFYLNFFSVLVWDNPSPGWIQPSATTYSHKPSHSWRKSPLDSENFGGCDLIVFLWSSHSLSCSPGLNFPTFFFFLICSLFLIFIYLFSFGYAGSSLLCVLFSSWGVGFSLVAASRGYSLLQYAGFSCCRARAPWPTGFTSCRVWALDHRLRWHTGLVAPWHVGSSPAGITPVCPALAGGFFYQWATREAPHSSFLSASFHPAGRDSECKFLSCYSSATFSVISCIKRPVLLRF